MKKLIPPAVIALMFFVLVLDTAYGYSFLALDKTPVREVNIEGRYAMDLPEYLTEGFTLNDEASLQYQNIYKEVYIIVIDESKQEFIDVFTELNDYDTTKTPLDNYARAQMESVRENMSKVTHESALRKFPLQCCAAIGYDVSGLQDGIENEMGFTVAFVEGRLNLYMIMTWTFQKDKKKYQKDMDDMILSFRELSGAIAPIAPAPTVSPVSLDIPEFMKETTKYSDALLCYESEFHKLTVALFSESISSWDSLYATREVKDQSMLDFFTLEQQSLAKINLKGSHSVTTPVKTRINGLDAQIFTLIG